MTHEGEPKPDTAPEEIRLELQRSLDTTWKNSEDLYRRIAEGSGKTEDLSNIPPPEPGTIYSPGVIFLADGLHKIMAGSSVNL